MRPKIIMLSDFGHRDAYVGIMKSVLLSRCPEAQIVDLCHEVPAQNVLSGSHILATAVPYLSPGTTVVAVVDPGVGGKRRAVAVRTEDHVFVAPDNGLLTETFDIQPPLEAVVLDKPSFHLPDVSRTFHGRDIFSPCAGSIAAGTPLTEVGTPMDVEALVRLPEIGPLIKDDSIECRVVHVDHFGNVITNLRRPTLQALEREVTGIKIKGVVAPLRSTFGDVAEGNAVCYFNSTEYLELGIANRSAAEQFELGQRAMLHVLTKPAEHV